MKTIHIRLLFLCFYMLCMSQVQATEKPVVHANHKTTSLDFITSQKENLQTKEEQEKAIAELAQKQHDFEIRYYLLAGFTLFLVLLFGVLCLFNNRGGKRLQKLITLVEKSKVSRDSHLHKNESNTEQFQLDIDDAIIDTILENLQAFENEHGFLTSKITLHSFAKQLQTNTKYLSKVINTYKSKSFRNYINDLRIQHSIYELERNTNYRKYTVSAMAKEAAFCSRESFTKAFQKKTGENVSNFVSQLN